MDLKQLVEFQKEKLPKNWINADELELTKLQTMIELCIQVRLLTETMIVIKDVLIKLGGNVLVDQNDISEY